jgi:hypothetical protein
MVKTAYIAEDGSKWDTYAKAQDHERKLRAPPAPRLDAAFRITAEALDDAGFHISAQRLRDLRKRVGKTRAQALDGYKPSEMCIPRDEKPVQYATDGVVGTYHPPKHEAFIVDATPRNIRAAFRKRPVAQAMGDWYTTEEAIAEAARRIATARRYY